MTRRHKMERRIAKILLLVMVAGALLVAAGTRYEMGGGFTVAGGIVMAVSFVTVVVMGITSDAPRQGRSRYITHQ